MARGTVNLVVCKGYVNERSLASDLVLMSFSYNPYLFIELAIVYSVIYV